MNRNRYSDHEGVAMKNKDLTKIILVFLIFLSIPVLAQYNPEWFRTSTVALSNGQLVDEVTIKGPPEPPEGYFRPVWKPTGEGQTRGSLFLACVPAFDWSFGCSATSAAMMAGYYDIIGRSNMYAGPTNGSVMPLDNSIWPDVMINGESRSQCPLSATREGLDGRDIKGHVDDYWISYGSPGPDPWVTGGWTEHTYGDCVGDYMFTNQWDVAQNRNTDGGTTFYFYSNGKKTRWNNLSGVHDGGAGLRSFMISRGYTVSDEYNQYIVEYGKEYGFSYSDYKSQIDNGRPVLIQLTGHTMLGLGYDDTDANKILVHDTWDYSDHWMIWGGSYSGMTHYAVTVIELSSISYTDLAFKNTTIGTGKQINLLATGTITGSADSTDEFLIIKGQCTMTAGSDIFLKPGFNAQSGSEFQAIISSTSQPGSNFNTEVGNSTIGNTDDGNILLGENAIAPVSLTIYPNPCSGRFTVMINGDTRNMVSLVITDMLGNIIYQKEQFPDNVILIDIRRHPKGVYALKAIYRNGMFSDKVVYR
jgi:hypothetical protein